MVDFAYFLIPKLSTNISKTCITFFHRTVPSAPNITALYIASDKFTLTWEEPEYLPGNLSGHEISLESHRLYPTPASCNYTNSSDYISNIEGSTFTYVFSNAAPYSNYTARIRAQTGAGWGNYSDYLVFETSSAGKMRLARLLPTINLSSVYLITNHKMFQCPEL